MQLVQITISDIVSLQEYVPGHSQLVAHTLNSFVAVESMEGILVRLGALLGKLFSACLLERWLTSACSVIGPLLGGVSQ